MKIVLVEERNGVPQAERAFAQDTVRVGRDPNHCEIVFEQSLFPSVSRRHAEFRLHNGRCWIVDSNSSYGTYLNGERIAGQAEARAGAVVQFGANGPVMRLKSLEAAAPSAVSSSAAASPAANQPQPARHPAPSAPAPTPPAVAHSGAPILQPIENAGNAPLEIKKDVLTLGRAPENDFVVEASAAVVSRKHAEIRRQNGSFALVDYGSFNGTFVNDQRIIAKEPRPLSSGDIIQLGLGGPVLRFDGGQVGGAQQSPQQRQQALDTLPADEPADAPRTMIGGKLNLSEPAAQKQAAGGQPQLLLRTTFNGKQELTVGRAAASDIRLDGLQISNRHARLVQTGAGVGIEDVNSTNGVYLGGKRITGRAALTPSDVAQIGPFQLRVDAQGNVFVFDTRSKTRIDALHITKTVKNRSGGGKLKLLDDVSLTVQPNEFVGLLGPSGAGKSTLMDALNGMRPPTEGGVFLNNLDFYENLDSLKQGIGYVPQDDIIHRELSVYRTLYYVAKLRLSNDVSATEIDQIINEVLDVTGLSERRDVQISQLSGGQRKRVSIAVELITKPSVIFLDEPTSGLDPATEDKIMKLFRRIAESGRTVILTTHAMENVRLFDKIVVLMRGKLVFYGTPQEALQHTGAKDFKELYDKLEAPIEEKIANFTEVNKADLKRQREAVTEGVAEDWKQRFLKTEQFRRNVAEPLSNMQQTGTQAKPPKRGLGVAGAIRQFLTLSRRYAQVLFRDKLNLMILLAQAPIIAFLTFLVMGRTQPRDFVYFILSIVAVWFGTSVAAREIIRERPVLNRERMVNLGLLPYIGSKLFVLGLIVGLQCLLLFLPLKFLDVVGVMEMPGVFGGIPQLFVVFLTALAGIALGLLISALVKTSEMATSLVPLILIPQILFSGLVGVPKGVSKLAGLTMPATWSFDAMKQFSGLDTLEPEGSDERGVNAGLGLYDAVEKRNDEIIAETRDNFDEYKRQMRNHIANQRQGIQSSEPSPPAIKDAEKLPEDLSDYVNFLHPWMNAPAAVLILLLMFFGLTVATVVVLRMQDIR